MQKFSAGSAQKKNLWGAKLDHEQCVLVTMLKPQAWYPYQDKCRPCLDCAKAFYEQETDE
jgi:hypothetical protein